MGDSWLKRTAKRLSASNEELDDADLRAASVKAGATPLEVCCLGQKVTVTGNVRSTRLDARGASPVLEVEVYDGTGVVTAVFLGRRRVTGVNPGRSVVVHGRLTRVEGRTTIFNPRYELVA